MWGSGMHNHLSLDPMFLQDLLVHKPIIAERIHAVDLKIYRRQALMKIFSVGK